MLDPCSAAAASSSTPAGGTTPAQVQDPASTPPAGCSTPATSPTRPCPRLEGEIKDAMIELFGLAPRGRLPRGRGRPARLLLRRRHRAPLEPVPRGRGRPRLPFGQPVRKASLSRLPCATGLSRGRALLIGRRRAPLSRSELRGRRAAPARSTRPRAAVKRGPMTCPSGQLSLASLACPRLLRPRRRLAYHRRAWLSPPARPADPRHPRRRVRRRVFAARRPRPQRSLRCRARARGSCRYAAGLLGFERTDGDSRSTRSSITASTAPRWAGPAHAASPC